MNQKVKVKKSKKWNPRQAQETRSATKAGKHATDASRGKTRLARLWGIFALLSGLVRKQLLCYCCIDLFYIKHDKSWHDSASQVHEIKSVSVLLYNVSYEAQLQPCTTACLVLVKKVIFSVQRVVVNVATLWKHPVVVLFLHSTEIVFELSDSVMLFIEPRL